MKKITILLVLVAILASVFGTGAIWYDDGESIDPGNHTDAIWYDDGAPVDNTDAIWYDDGAPVDNTDAIWYDD